MKFTVTATPTLPTHRISAPRTLAIPLSVGAILITLALETSAAQPPADVSIEPRSSGDAAQAATMDRRLPLHVKDRRLDELLEALSRHSGIRFELNSELRERRITTTLQGRDWSAAVRSFLKDFNHIAIVDQGGGLRRVWITGFEAVSPITAEAGNVEDGPASRTALSVPPAADHVSLPLPLWQPAPGHTPTANGTPGEPIEMDPTVLDNLAVGQPLEIVIPQEGQSVLGVVSEAHEQLGGEVQVWSGPVDGSHESASFTISRGVRTTYVTVSTGSRIYEVSVDNTTGVGEVIDEVDMTRGKDGDDIVLAPSSDIRR